MERKVMIFVNDGQCPRTVRYDDSHLDGLEDHIVRIVRETALVASESTFAGTWNGYREIVIRVSPPQCQVEDRICCEDPGDHPQQICETCIEDTREE